MGILEEIYSDLKRMKRKAKRKAIHNLKGDTKGERWNKRRLKMAQEAWSYYSGPLSRNEFMSEYMRAGVARNKKVLKKQVGKWDATALERGKKLTVDDILDTLKDVSVNRTPKSETNFVETVCKNIDGGIIEYGDFKFAGTIHRPDYYVNKNIVFEFKIIQSNTELHTAIGQALIYTYKYSHVFLIIFDARHGYGAVDLTDDELKFLLNHEVILSKYPR